MTYEITYNRSRRAYELADSERHTFNIRLRGGVWLTRDCTAGDDGKLEYSARLTDATLIAAYNAAVSEHQSRHAANGRIDSLYNARGQRVSLATGRRVVQRKQPRGTWRDDRGGA